MTTLHAATFAQLDAATLYEILRLRTDVFVVEQACAYPELDGRDTHPGTLHLWYADGGSPVCYLRVLADGDGAVRLGRVVTAPDARRRGLGAQLVRAALDRTSGPVVIDAQAQLQAWYEQLGFSVSGEGFVEDGIAHVPMRLDR